MEGEPWIADDRKVVLPPREELHTSMESLIHHFKIVTEGYRVPEGEIYQTIESPRGELGCYVVSDGGPKPWRVKFRAPSFVALEATATCLRDSLIADMIAIVGSLDTVMGEVDR
jgi:NADH-quinone oxidoreductase subunit D